MNDGGWWWMGKCWWMRALQEVRVWVEDGGGKNGVK